MNIESIIATVVLVVVLGSAIAYIINAKKRGDACIGCPHAKKCGAKCSGGCSCSNEENKEKTD